MFTFFDFFNITIIEIGINGYKISIAMLKYILIAEYIISEDKTISIVAYICGINLLKYISMFASDDEFITTKLPVLTAFV